jgi:hypothetical protein
MAAAFARFDGTWIGETQGFDSPAHLWEIRQNGRMLSITSRWEGEAGPGSGPYTGTVLPDQPAFQYGGFTALLVDPQHFIIFGWDTNDTRGGAGPAYDVVFSRPGIAELTAHAAWEKHRQRIGSM